MPHSLMRFLSTQLQLGLVISEKNFKPILLSHQQATATILPLPSYNPVPHAKQSPPSCNRGHIKGHREHPSQIKADPDQISVHVAKDRSVLIIGSWIGTSTQMVSGDGYQNSEGIEKKLKEKKNFGVEFVSHPKASLLKQAPSPPPASPTVSTGLHRQFNNMGEHSHSRHKKKRSQVEDGSDSHSSSPLPTSSDSLSSSEDERSKKKRRSKDDKRHRKSSSRREKKSRRDKKHKRMEKEHNKLKRDKSKKKKRDYSESDESGSESKSDNESDVSLGRESPEEVVKCILEEFPAVAVDLEQLLHMIDDGQAVDINGLSGKSLIKHLRKLFVSLKLKEKGDNCFLLPSKVRPTLEVVGAIIQSHVSQSNQDKSKNEMQSLSPDSSRQETNDAPVGDSHEEVGPTRRRMFGPEMPSAELLAAAAKLTEAEAEMREAELEADTEVFIGPPPPAVVVEAESSNEAERFEEITRIMVAETDNPYDILGVNRNMPAENMKKRYWKLSLMVHPDKCSHPQAHQAFVKLNKAFKELQDPEKRKALDEKIKLKEEQEEFKVELKALREAAQWRRLQGISIEGDDILLAETDVQVAPKRDEWMTTLPPERKPGMTMQSTRFSKTSKEGRGDTSVWTDTPSEKAQKAKMNYLEAYNEAAALASSEQEKKRSNADAELVDQYNKAKRSKALVEKHQESTRTRSKKKSKQEPGKEEWEGKHPWKPWDRERDLTAGRQSVKLDAEDMAQGLSSRFSSGSFQRSFL